MRRTSVLWLVVSITQAFPSGFLPITGDMMRLHERADQNDPCIKQENLTGKERYDCKKVRTLDGNGDCPVDKSAIDTQCYSYCEIRRRLIVGEEIKLRPINGDFGVAGKEEEIQSTKGSEFSITQSIDVGLGLSAGYKEAAVSAGGGFSYSTTDTTTTSVARTGKTSAKYNSRWYAFPLYVETCSTLTNTLPAVLARGVGISGRTSTVVNSSANTCSTVPYRGIEGNKPVSEYKFHWRRLMLT
jgi:hypothetical protein